MEPRANEFIPNRVQTMRVSFPGILQPREYYFYLHFEEIFTNNFLFIFIKNRNSKVMVGNPYHSNIVDAIRKI